MTRTRLSTILSAAASVTSLVIGVVAVKWYVWDIAIQQSGEPDRSMLFWGIPIVFIGIAALAVGGSLAAVARRGLTKTQTDGQPARDL